MRFSLFTFLDHVCARGFELRKIRQSLTDRHHAQEELDFSVEPDGFYRCKGSNGRLDEISGSYCGSTSPDTAHVAFEFTEFALGTDLRAISHLIESSIQQMFEPRTTTGKAYVQNSWMDAGLMPFFRCRFAHRDRWLPIN